MNVNLMLTFKEVCVIGGGVLEKMYLYLQYPIQNRGSLK